MHCTGRLKEVKNHVLVDFYSGEWGTESKQISKLYSMLRENKCCGHTHTKTTEQGKGDGEQQRRVSLNLNRSY